MRIDDFARTVHVPRLKPGRRVRDFLCIVNSESVKSSGFRCIGYDLKPTMIVAFLIAALKRQAFGFPVSV
jgi:hypothetical protein